MSMSIRNASNEPNNLRHRFLSAIERGELGHVESRGIIITTKEFRFYFSDIKTQYTVSFLPAATIEPGRTHMTYTKYLFRLRKGVYLLHPDMVLKN